MGKMKKLIVTAISGAIFLTSAFPGMSSEITLTNGDRISGIIVNKDGEKIIIKTAYAGNIAIDWGDVNSFASDAKMQIVLADGTSINGNAIQSQPGSITIKSGQILETAPIALNQITAINPPAVDGKAVKFSGHANAGLSMTEGNTDTQKVHIDVEAVARTSENRYTIGGAHNKAETDGVESEDNLTGYMKYDHFFTPKWYSYSNALFTKDQYRDLNLMTAIGIGAGYQVWETTERNLGVELGISYVNEDYIAGEDNGYPAGRWAVNYDQLLFNKITQFFHKHEGLLGLEQVTDVTILSQTGLRFPLIDNLNATIQVNWDWDNTPAPDTKRADTDYLFTLGYAW